MRFKNSNFTLLLPKIWLLNQILNNERSIINSDPAIQIDTTTYCNISPQTIDERYDLKNIRNN